MYQIVNGTIISCEPNNDVISRNIKENKDMKKKEVIHNISSKKKKEIFK